MATHEPQLVGADPRAVDLDGSVVDPTTASNTDRSTGRTIDPAGGEPTGGAPRAERFSWADFAERFALVGAWAVLTLFFLITNEAFRQPDTLKVIIGAQGTQLAITLAVVFSLIGGEFDLSVANVLGASAVGLVFFNVELGLPIGLALLAVAAMVIVFASINAVLVIKVGLPSVIVTLGMGTLLSGIWAGIAGTSPRNGADRGFVSVISHQFFGIPAAFFIVLATGGVLYYVLTFTPVGRHYTFAGRNREVARLTGLRVNRLRAASLIGCSLLAGLGGVLLVGRTGAADPGVAGGYLLPALAGAFLGSTTIRPGEFNIWGAFVAVYFLVTGVIGLQLSGYTGWVENVFYGASLVLAVLLTQLVAKHRGRARGISVL